LVDDEKGGKAFEGDQEEEKTDKMRSFVFKFIKICLVLGLILGMAGCKEEQTAKEVPRMTPRVPKVKPVIPIRAQPFFLTQVRLLDGPFKESMERDRLYLHELDPDRLLHNFRVNAGLPSSAEPLGGWERPDVELRGHTVGHFLSACALMYASTGDAELKAKADGMVAELAKVQKALGPTGYLSAFPEEFFDRAEATERVWAPYYTLHKILAGLLDMCVYCENGQALAVAERLAAWVKMRTDKLDEEQMQRMLDKTEQGGMNDVLSNLYALTGKAEYFKLARRFDQKSYTEPLAGYKDELKGLHANSFIPNMVGTAREYELTGDPVLRRIASFFWTQIVEARSYATGGTSNNEGWRTDPYEMAGELGPDSHETCCTYNMLKLTRHLFSWDADPRYADYYERALFNGILPTQNPEDGMMMYYVPMASGLYKTFMTPRNSFWCCTGTGMESHAKYGGSIYFHDDEGIYVNLFVASELDWSEKGVRLRQETRFPEQEVSSFYFNLNKATPLTLRIRIPSWIGDEGYVEINGLRLETFSNAGSYLELRRTWRDHDRVDVFLPMNLHLYPMPDDPYLDAIMYGPLVLAGELGEADLPEEEIYGKYGPGLPPVPVPYFVGDIHDLRSWIEPIDDEPLKFRTVDAGVPKDVTLIPFYRLFGQRYAIYWKIKKKAE
jgi:DUF1680 family protein